ncbi:MAG: LytTR family transcriptional regulator DNA-binding domain-containing protein [Bacteroidota bacterium]
MKSKCSALFLLLFSTFSLAQHHIYQEFGINDGLPSLEVHALFQDKNGLIWFATDRGMANYNGYEITKGNSENELANAVVLDVFSASEGKIYAATYTNQLYYLNETLNRFQPYEYNHILKEKLAFKNHIIDVFEDAKQNLHISCEYLFEPLIISKQGRIVQESKQKWPKARTNFWMKLDKKNDATVLFYYTADSIVKEKNVRKVNVKVTSQNEAILLKESGYVVYSNGEEINILNDKGVLIKTIKNGKSPIGLKALNSTTFFVGYYFGGGVFMDVEGNVQKRFLPNESVSDFIIDHEGGYWFSTLHSGVFYIKEPYIKAFETSINSPVRTLTKTKTNDLYIGYQSGEVLKLDADKNLASEIEPTHSFGIVEYNPQEALLYVKSGNYFYTKNSKGKRSFFNDSIAFSYYTKISEPVDNKIIVSCQNGFRVLENKKPTYFNISMRVNDAVFLKDTYYVGTPLGAFAVKNGQKTALTEIDPIFKHRVDDVDVNAARNEIYFATLGSGIIIYNIKTKEVQVIKAAEGLSSDNVNEIYVENKDEIWACTSAGLNKIRFAPKNTYHISGLESSNGLLNDGINDIEIINDTVWIASKKDLMYAPKHLFDTNITSNNYHLKVQSVLVNDSLVSQKALQYLSHTENRIDFFVQGIYFKAPNELQYTYILEGLDTKWYDTKNRRISYSALPYGNYTFKVAATTFENEERRICVEIPIQIQAPFWKRPWFIIAVILGIVTLIYLFFRYRILSYNRHIIRELLRLLIKKIKRKELYFSFKEAGKEIRIKTDTILYIKSAGNYVEVVTEQKNYTIRTKIGEFINLMPDPLEYLRIHRSYIIRIDKVAEKNSKEVTVNKQKIPVSNSYVAALENLIF